MAYRLLVDLDAIAVLDSVPKSIRVRLLDRFEKKPQFGNESRDILFQSRSKNSLGSWPHALQQANHSIKSSRRSPLSLLET